MSASLHKWYARPSLDAFAERRTVLRGDIGLERLARLAELPYFDADAAGGPLTASLRFERRHEGWLAIELEYRADLPLVCQRCLETFVYPASARFAIGLIDTPSVEELLPKGYEPVVLEEDRLMPARLIEDELIIAIPLVPRHASVAECGDLVHDNEMLEREDHGVTLSCAHETSH